jgi:hypothetical protein
METVAVEEEDGPRNLFTTVHLLSRWLAHFQQSLAVTVCKIGAPPGRSTPGPEAARERCCRTEQDDVWSRL